jgi:hypothetical protein
VPADWLTVDDVAAYLDLPGVAADDDNLVLSVAAVKAAIERRRSDLDLLNDATIVPGDVHGGAVMWAALVYQNRNLPDGAETVMWDALGPRRSEVLRLIGWRRPVAY